MGLKGGACDVSSDDWPETTTGPSVPWMSINPAAWHESKCRVGPTRATAELLLPRGKFNDVAVGEPECSNVQVVLFWTLTYSRHVPLIHLVFCAALLSALLAGGIRGFRKTSKCHKNHGLCFCLT